MICRFYWRRALKCALLSQRRLLCPRRERPHATQLLFGKNQAFDRYSKMENQVD